MTSIDGTASQDELGNDINIDGNMAHDDGSHHIDVHDAEMSNDTHQLGVSNGVTTPIVLFDGGVHALVSVVSQIDP